MWSGPRNISTAMMRAWENRGDCAVVDEPFYAHYLAETGLGHPMRAEILASQPTDWRRVVTALTSPAPGGEAVFFQKHMLQHLTPSIGRDWLGLVDHVFLIRDPAEMVASYAAKMEAASPEALGADIQVALYEEVAKGRAHPPPVIDAADVLRDPRGVLTMLCASLDLPFTERMLEWPKGARASDGVWEAHWYDAVRNSTGFAPYAPKRIALPPDLLKIADACRPAYEFLHARRLTA